MKNLRTRTTLSADAHVGKRMSSMRSGKASECTAAHVWVPNKLVLTKYSSRNGVRHCLCDAKSETCARAKKWDKRTWISCSMLISLSKLATSFWRIEKRQAGMHAS